MVNLAEAYERVGEKERAAELFNEFFRALDGRSELSSNMGTSIKSRLSRGLSIKTKSNTTVSYRKSSTNQAPKNKQNPNAIQRVAVTLRQKQEFKTAERLML
jgi:hypothetical protein